jgi:hypothetical protein
MMRMHLRTRQQALLRGSAQPWPGESRGCDGEGMVTAAMRALLASLATPLPRPAARVQPQGCAWHCSMPSIPEALIAEMSGRTPLDELPHCKGPIAHASGEPWVGGMWQYDTAEVSKDL